MVPPVAPDIYKRKIIRTKKKPELSDIKEEDEQNKKSEEFSSVYLTPQESKQKKITTHIPKIKKTSKPKESTSKHKSITTKTVAPKNEVSEKEKKETPSKRKRKVIKTKTKLETPTDQSILTGKDIPIISKYKPLLNPNYVPVIRSFVNPDMTSLPIDTILAKQRTESKLPKPTTRVRPKKIKKSSKDTSDAKFIVEEKIVKKKSNKESTKRIKPKTDVSKIPKRVSTKKRSDNKKLVAKIPLK